jgi:hypothetical protein
MAAYFVLMQPAFCYFVFARDAELGWRDIAQIYAAPVLLGAAAVAISSVLVDAVDRAAWFQLCFVPPATLAMYVPVIRVFCPRSYRVLRGRVVAFLTGSAT